MTRSRSGKRDTSDITSDPLLSLTAPIRPSPIYTPTQVLAMELQSLQEVEDRRTWHPAQELRPLLTAAGRRAVQKTRNQFDFTRPLRTVYGIVSSPNPLNTALVCARRKARREVLHALRQFDPTHHFRKKRRGKGGGYYKPRSKIRC